MNRILVTGATGFIGRSVVDALLAEGGAADVHGTTRRVPDDGPDGVTYHAVDLLDADAVTQLLADVRPTHLLHLAWDLSPGSYQSAHNVGWVRASLHLMEQFHAHGGERFVGTGSCFEYDFAHGYCTEDVTPLDASTLYGRTKSHLAGLVDAYGSATDLSTAWARVFFVYGPHEAEHRLVPDVIQSLRRGESVACTHGEQIRDYMHAADVAAACIAILRSDVTGAVNVGTGDPVRLKDIIFTLADALSGRDLIRLGARDPQPDEPPLLVANPSRLRDDVGFTPAFSLDRGLRDTVDWWTQQPLPTPAASSNGLSSS